MLSKITRTYATHNIPLECDILESPTYPSTTPVFLFFHSGGLVAGSRACIPPWLVQVCYQRQWPLVSASYRLLPQTGGQGLIEDATAAYRFAENWRTNGIGSKRRVIVGGASAGFFLAALIAHHVSPSPLALLCITGIATFRHAFFNSGTLLTPEPIKDEEMTRFIEGPVVVGRTSEGDRTAFTIDQLLPSGLKNVSYEPPQQPAAPTGDESPERGMLYDYYLYRNDYPKIVGDVDPGFEKISSDSQRLGSWPHTILIQGSEDYDVSPAVTRHVFEQLGSERAKLCLAENQGHLFEAKSFLEDEGKGMESVRQAVRLLDEVLGRV